MSALAGGRSGARQLRPLAVGEVLDVAIKIVWRNAGNLMRVVVFVVLPVQVVTTVIQLSVAPSGAVVTGYPPRLVSPNPYKLVATSHGTVLQRTDTGAQIVGLLVAALLGLVATALASGACYRAITTSYLGEGVGWRESLGFGIRRLHSLVWLVLLSTVIPVLALFACIVPGVYLWTGFAVVVPVLMTENRRGFKALGRSRELVAGYWWRTFAVVILGFVLSLIVGGIADGLVLAIASWSGGLWVWGVVTTLGGTVSHMVTTPFVAAFITVLYFDLRVRKEAFDLQLLAGQIGVEPPADWAPSGPPPTSQPPFWPPPPGWKPPANPDPPSPPPAEPQPGGVEPPFWPPPPGWKPGSPG